LIVVCLTLGFGSGFWVGHRTAGVTPPSGGGVGVSGGGNYTHPPGSGGYDNGCRLVYDGSIPGWLHQFGVPSDNRTYKVYSCPS
jgi:hypothetical protein